MTNAIQVITYAIQTPQYQHVHNLLCLVCEHIDYLHVLHHMLNSRLLVNKVPTAYAVNEKQ